MSQVVPIVGASEKQTPSSLAHADAADQTNQESAMERFSEHILHSFPSISLFPTAFLKAPLPFTLKQQAGKNGHYVISKSQDPRLVAGDRVLSINSLSLDAGVSIKTILNGPPLQPLVVILSRPPPSSGKLTQGDAEMEFHLLRPIATLWKFCKGSKKKVGKLLPLLSWVMQHPSIRRLVLGQHNVWAPPIVLSLISLIKRAEANIASIALDILSGNILEINPASDEGQKFWKSRFVKVLLTLCAKCVKNKKKSALLPAISRFFACAMHCAPDAAIVDKLMFSFFKRSSGSALPTQMAMLSNFLSCNAPTEKMCWTVLDARSNLHSHLLQALASGKPSAKTEPLRTAIARGIISCFLQLHGTQVYCNLTAPDLVLRITTQQYENCRDLFEATTAALEALPTSRAKCLLAACKLLGLLAAEQLATGQQRILDDALDYTFETEPLLSLLNDTAAGLYEQVPSMIFESTERLPHEDTHSLVHDACLATHACCLVSFLSYQKQSEIAPIPQGLGQFVQGCCTYIGRAEVSRSDIQSVFVDSASCELLAVCALLTTMSPGIFKDCQSVSDFICKSSSSQSGHLEQCLSVVSNLPQHEALQAASFGCSRFTVFHLQLLANSLFVQSRLSSSPVSQLSGDPLLSLLCRAVLLELLPDNHCMDSQSQGAAIRVRASECIRFLVTAQSDEGKASVTKLCISWLKDHLGAAPQQVAGSIGMQALDAGSRISSQPLLPSSHEAVRYSTAAPRPDLDVFRISLTVIDLLRQMEGTWESRATPAVVRALGKAVRSYESEEMRRASAWAIQSALGSSNFCVSLSDGDLQWLLSCLSEAAALCAGDSMCAGVLSAAWSSANFLAERFDRQSKEE